MARYKLSKLADEDIESFFEYGIDNFGVEAAKGYLERLTGKLQMIAQWH